MTKYEKEGKLAVKKIGKLPEGTTNDIPRTGRQKTKRRKEGKTT
jgi:hypothetical protein